MKLTNTSKLKLNLKIYLWGQNTECNVQANGTIGNYWALYGEQNFSILIKQSNWKHFLRMFRLPNSSENSRTPGKDGMNME